MTRETKVGMIVAGSFLCLVCVVVASKLRHGDDPAKGASEEQTAPGAIAAVGPKQNTPPPEVKKKKEEHPKGEAPLKSPPAVDITNRQPPLVQVELPGVVTPPPQPFVVPPPNDTPTVSVILPPPVLRDKDKGVIAPPMPTQPLVGDKKTVTDVPSPKPLDTAFPMLPPLPGPKDTTKTPKDGPPAFPSIQPKDVTPIIKPFAEKDPPGSAPKEGPPTFPTPKDGPPTFPTLPAANDGPPSFPTLPAPKDAQRVTPKDGPPTFPLGQPMPLPGAEIKPPPSITITEPIKPGPGVIPPGPIPIIPSGSNLHNMPGTFDAFEKTKNPAAKPMPIISDNDVHSCQPGETTFAALSLKFYGTDKYAQALLRYNRDNYKATVNGSVFLSDAPVLQTGQQVHVAPVAILDRDYLTVRPVSSGPIPTIPSTAPTAPPLLKPMPLNPAITAVSNPPTTGTARTYVVQNPSGESILDIAERTLGDRGQWHKIWRANPSYPPQVRIPAGAKLEIPAN